MVGQRLTIVVWLVAGSIASLIFVVVAALLFGVWKFPSGEPAPEVLAAGIEAYQANDLAGLDTAIDTLRDQPGHRAEVQLLTAMKFIRQQKLQNALDLLYAAAEHPTTKAWSLALAGELLFRLQDFKNAEGVLKAAIAADPTRADPHRWLAAWYFDVGAMDDALLHLEEVAKLEPEDARPWRMRGMILSDFERHAEAIEAYREALKRTLPDHVAQEVHAELAGSLLAGRQPEEALVHLDQCPASATTLSLRADCQLALGDLDAADSALTRALELEPEHAKALMLKASLARERGQLDLAAETLEQAVSLHPYEFDFRFHLMSAYNALGQTEKADEQRVEMERLRELRTRFTELHHQSMQDPNSSELRFELGTTAEQLGKTEMAISWYQAAVALDPQNEKAHAALQAITQSPSNSP